MLRETENVANLIKSNADQVAACSLERLNELIEDKKDARNGYSDERKRIDDELRKVSIKNKFVKTCTVFV